MVKSIFEKIFFKITWRSPPFF